MDPPAHILRGHKITKFLVIRSLSCKKTHWREVPTRVLTVAARLQPDSPSIRNPLPNTLHVHCWFSRTYAQIHILLLRQWNTCGVFTTKLKKQGYFHPPDFYQITVTKHKRRKTFHAKLCLTLKRKAMLAQALSDKFKLQMAWKWKLKGTSGTTLPSLPWAMAAHSDTGSIMKHCSWSVVVISCPGDTPGGICHHHLSLSMMQHTCGSQPLDGDWLPYGKLRKVWPRKPVSVFGNWKKDDL